MSILQKFNNGFLISHSQLINEIYKDLHIEVNPNLFKIYNAFKKQNIKNQLKLTKSENFEEFEEQAEKVKMLFNCFLEDYKKTVEKIDYPLTNKNDEALKTASEVYQESGKVPIEAFGFNEDLGIRQINSVPFVFPKNCQFYCKDVIDIGKHLSGKKYDLILLDPPWWNKYIRRKRKTTSHAYDMIFNDDLKNLPLENLLADDGMIVVWCTNSPKHSKQLQDEIFPKWGVEFTGKWYWVKVTVNIEPVCNFSKPPKKQPFEQIIFACKNGKTKVPPTNKLVISVPSALHSHKPPLINLLEEYLPDNPSCLEIFARYLLPGWTSYGKEALRFQNNCLFIEKTNGEVDKCT